VPAQKWSHPRVSGTEFWRAPLRSCLGIRPNGRVPGAQRTAQSVNQVIPRSLKAAAEVKKRAVAIPTRREKPGFDAMKRIRRGKSRRLTVASLVVLSALFSSLLVLWLGAQTRPDHGSWSSQFLWDLLPVALVESALIFGAGISLAVPSRKWSVPLSLVICLESAPL
jgi:hypothetical protein